MRLVNPFARSAVLERFVAPAAARSQVWRTLLGGCLFALAVLAMTFGLGLALIAAAPTAIDPTTALTSPEGVLFALSTFIVWWIALALALALAHRRRVSSVFGAGRGAPGFLTGFLVALALGVAGFLIGGFVAGWPARTTLSPSEWAVGALVASPLLLIQTGAEEAVFRGYLLQQLAARFRSPIIWAVLPSLAFGALHWNPLAPGGAWPIVVITSVVGLVLAAVTARAGGLSVAWGLHFGVNLTAIVFVSSPDYLSGLAFAHWPSGGETALVWLDVALILAAAFAAWAWISRSPPAD